jgi:hypothetical protein
MVNERNMKKENYEQASLACTKLAEKVATLNFLETVQSVRFINNHGSSGFQIQVGSNCQPDYVMDSLGSSFLRAVKETLRSQIDAQQKEIANL